MYVCSLVLLKTFKLTLAKYISGRVHSYEKVYKCIECDYAANVSCDLQNHMMRMHSSDKPYKCETCDLRFSTKTKRNNHIAQGKQAIAFYFRCNLTKSLCEIDKNLSTYLWFVICSRFTKSFQFINEVLIFPVKNVPIKPIPRICYKCMLRQDIQSQR